MMSMGETCMDPRGTVARIYKEDLYIHKIGKLWALWFQIKYFFYVFPLKAMGANDPRDEVIFDPMSMIGRITKRITIHSCTQNMKALGLVVSEKNIFFMFFL